MGQVSVKLNCVIPWSLINFSYTSSTIRLCLSVSDCFMSCYLITVQCAVRLQQLNASSKCRVQWHSFKNINVTLSPRKEIGGILVKIIFRTFSLSDGEILRSAARGQGYMDNGLDIILAPNIEHEQNLALGETPTLGSIQSVLMLQCNATCCSQARYDCRVFCSICTLHSAPPSNQSSLDKFKSEQRSKY